jgi:transposase
MSNEDARSLPGAAQAALRKRAVQAVLGGMTQAEAARVFGVHPNAVNRWMQRYRQGGWAALSERRRGRRAGEQAALSASQQQEIIALVRDSTPDELGLPGFLWTREAVAELIAQRYRVRLARTTVGLYLRSWRFSPQSPGGAPWSNTRRRWRAGLPRNTPRSWRRPSGRVGWCGGWMSWACVPTMPRGGRGRRWATPRWSSGPASGLG